MVDKVDKGVKSSHNSSQKSPQTSASIAGDIPVAIRDTPSAAPQSWWKLVLIACAGLGFGGLGMIATIIIASMQPPLPSPAASNNLANSSEVPSSDLPNSPILPTSSTSSLGNTPEANPSSSPDTLLGHYPYAEAPSSDLQAIEGNPEIKLRRAAAVSLEAMVKAAEAEGVILVPLSGFRSIDDQQYLFFDIKAERGQVATKRAEVSAPPGYSEHHTGYAVDVGDGKVPATNLSTDFENTETFRWLQKNAARFNFELSFPLNNSQGISYEPWHWRFVGDIQSLETFYKTRQGNP
ncbi:MAG: D-alanyl-D-alanine carboxypeptidase family protein [Coleofasciculaceae cyanobacterium SM2_1_6]|nr:D-alanyl-D-alanine carboxypeptidase family protein [Coleofasciculaceae cyanobacterium SM2_1_6]